MSEEQKPAKAERKVVDWDVIEVEYRAGQKTLEQIGKEHGLTKGRIAQVAKSKEWTRDIQGKIKAKADAKVQAAVAKKRLEEEALNDPAKQAKRRLAESEIVDANSESQFQIRMTHRSDLVRTRLLFGRLLGELERTTDNLDLFEQLGELLDESGPDASGRWRADKQNELYRKVISLSGRVANGKQLVEMYEKVVRMERQAHGIDDAEDRGKTQIEDLLAKVAAAGRAQGLIEE